jgi:TRAP-type transport system small permease protein
MSIIVEADPSDADKAGDQRQFLPPAWRGPDRAIVKATEIAVFAIGALFTVLVSLEVLSRYVFQSSIMFVNAGAKFLLVWFFVVGAGLALRMGAHVGFELLLGLMRPRRRRRVVVFSQWLAMIFFVEMIGAGLYSLGPAWRQSEPGLEIRLFWAFLAIPVGFTLLAYHMAVLIAVEIKRGGARP